MIIDQERLESLQKIMIAASFLALLSIYGGTGFGGVWYGYDFDGNISDGEEQGDYGTDVETEGSYEYLLKEVEGVVSMEGFYAGQDVDERDKDTYDYGDNDCNCRDREDVMKNTINLAYLGFVSSLVLLAIIYQLLRDSEGLARLLKLDQYGGTETLVTNVQRLSFVAAGACLLSAAYFALSYPDAWDEDTEVFDEWDEDPVFMEDTHQEWNDESYLISADVKFGPGIGWFLMIASGLANVWVANELKNNFPVQAGMGNTRSPINAPPLITPPSSLITPPSSFLKKELVPPPFAEKKEPIAPEEKKKIAKKKTVAKKPPPPKKKKSTSIKKAPPKKETEYQEPDVSVMAIPEDEGD